MKPKIFITGQLSNGSMFRRAFDSEHVGQEEFFASFGFPAEIELSLISVRNQLN
jgi:hypothetical protein